MTRQLWRTITANALWRGAQLVSVFLLNVAIARVFKAEGSGDFLFLIANFQLAASVASLSLESGIQYYGAADTTLLGGFSAFIFRYAGIASAVLLGILTAVLVSHWLKPSIDPVLFVLYAIGFICGTLMFRSFSVLAVAVRAFTLPTVVEAGGNLVLLAVLGLQYLFSFRDGVHIFFLLFYGMPLACSLVIFAALRRRYASLFVSSDKRRVHLPSLFRYSGLAFLSNLVFWGVYRMDFWWVAIYCPSSELGNYIQASKLAQLFIYLPQVIAMVIFPDVVQDMSTGSRGTIRRLMGYTMILYTVGVGVVLLAGSRGLVWLLGPTFDQVYPAFLRLIPGVYALGPLTILAAYFAGRNRVKVNLYGGLAALVVMLLGDLVFIPHYHIMGAALVSSASYTTYMVYEWAVFVSPEKASRAAPTVS
jgi:O-antigen/teichoic acid export membrane protein